MKAPPLPPPKKKSEIPSLIGHFVTVSELVQEPHETHFISGLL